MPDSPPASGPLLFAGDPHGNFAPILRACAARPPGTLVLLGDCDCARPLTDHLAPAIAAGWDVRWILGNHDTETEATFDNLTSCPGDFGLRVITVGNMRLAGLPGVFKPRVWQPDEGPPAFHTRAAFLAALQRDWRGGLPLWHRDTIFPEDVACLAEQRFDILVSHEAPSTHPFGHTVIDTLARSAGARLIVHGHHHQSYEAMLPDGAKNGAGSTDGIRVRGLGLAEPWPLDALPGA